MKFRKKSELSEDQIEKDFSNYVGIMSAITGHRYRLVSVCEQTTGSDAFLDPTEVALPMYIQYKVSEGLEISGRTVPWTHSVIRRITNFRKEQDFTDDPILYFKLRKIAAEATDYQHNILLKHVSDDSFAFYLAPLTLDRDKFYNSLTSSNELIHWRHLQKIYGVKPSEIIALTPGFKSCITITPQDAVDTSDHYYSYNLTGGNICFHSPSVVSTVTSRWSDVLYEIIKRTQESGYESFGQIQERHFFQLMEGFSNPPYRDYLSYCQYLYSTHGIRAYLFVVRR